MTAQSGWVKIWVMSLPNLFFLGAMLLNTPKPIFIPPKSNKPTPLFPAGGVNVMSATLIFFFFLSFLPRLFVRVREDLNVSDTGPDYPIALVSSAFPKQISCSDLVPTYTYHQKYPSTTWQSTIP